MSLRLEMSRGAALQAATLKDFVRGLGVTGFPRWKVPVNCPGRGQAYVIKKRPLAT